MQFNGWKLGMCTMHGVRVWESDSGEIVVKGFGEMPSYQIDRFIEWLSFCQITRTQVPIGEQNWLVSESEMNDLLMSDYHTIMEYGRP